MRRPRAIVLLVVALLAGIIALGAWLRGDRPDGRRAEEEGPAPPSASAPRPTRDGGFVLTEGPPSTDAPPSAAPAGDENLLAGIRAQVRSDPRKAEALAREGRARFPNSPHADEWDALLVDALVNQQRIGAARSETYYYYDHHPGGAFAAHLFALTGVHPAAPGSGPP